MKIKVVFSIDASGILRDITEVITIPSDTCLLTDINDAIKLQLNQLGYETSYYFRIVSFCLIEEKKQKQTIVEKLESQGFEFCKKNNEFSKSFGSLKLYFYYQFNKNHWSAWIKELKYSSQNDDLEQAYDAVKKRINYLKSEFEKTHIPDVNDFKIQPEAVGVTLKAISDLTIEMIYCHTDYRGDSEWSFDYTIYNKGGYLLLDSSLEECTFQSAITSLKQNIEDLLTIDLL